MNRTYIFRHLLLSSFVILSMLLIGCSSSTPTPTDGMTELESLADSSGDIDVILQVDFQPRSQMNSTQLPEADVEWVYFTATTPQGQSLHGLYVTQPTLNCCGNFDIQDLKFRGSVGKLQDNKVMIGVASFPNEDDKRLLGTFILSRTDAVWVGLGGAQNYQVTDEVQSVFVHISALNMSVFAAKGNDAGVVLGWLESPSNNLTSAMLNKAAGTLEFSAFENETTPFSPVRRGNGLFTMDAGSSEFKAVALGSKPE